MPGIQQFFSPLYRRLRVVFKDVLYTFFKNNAKASVEELHQTVVLEVQSYGWKYLAFAIDCPATNVLRFKQLSTVTLPNNLKTLAILEGFYAFMMDMQAAYAVVPELVFVTVELISPFTDPVDFVDKATIDFAQAIPPAVYSDASVPAVPSPVAARVKFPVAELNVTHVVAVAAAIEED
ncbi:hypothetical protein HDU90_003977 [Geranomyces variabilis]|nr:hypothetical protein HDU90_003977 [Geranomyces variabilis]